MELWSRARSFAEEAAKRSQEISSTISGSKLTDIVSETAKRSKELASEASNHMKAEALKRADQIKSLSLLDPSLPLTLPVSLYPLAENSKQVDPDPDELERFGVTDDLREFVKTLSISTFQDFPLLDDGPVSDAPTVANVRQDLTDWQARHATLVFSAVKEVSKLRYELCPRIMKERKFWKIYFMLVNCHVTAYEKKYVEAKLKSAEQERDNIVDDEPTKVGAEAAHSLKKATSAAEQDLDVFLLGDLADSDEGPDGADDGFDDDFDKIDDNSEDELSKDPKN